MKKLVSLVSALAVLVAFSFGCGQYAFKDGTVMCPKCGAVFTIDEGLQVLQKQL